jgi:hypothetical protein
MLSADRDAGITHRGSDPDPAIAVPDLTSTARIKLNERMLLLNCPVWLNVAKPLGGLQLV